MEGASKNSWSANYSKPEIWPAEPERVRTSDLDAAIPIGKVTLGVISMLRIPLLYPMLL